MPEADAGTATVAESGDPLEPPRRIALLREALDGAEAVAVRRAGVSGTSWAFIATPLDVTRHAVHGRSGRS